MEFAESEWSRLGAPTDHDELLAVLEQILNNSVDHGPGYARILLKRKKQLQRGEWHLAPPAPPGPAAGTAQSIRKMIRDLERQSRKYPGASAEIPFWEEKLRSIEQQG